MSNTRRVDPDEILNQFVPQSEAARMLGVSRQAVSSWIARGKVTPHYLYGGTLTVLSVEDIEAIRARRENFGGAAIP